MNYAAIKNCDIANGPGVRVSLFVSGCRHHCKDCFNPETWDFAYGEPFDEAAIDRILALMAPGYIRGITYLGGEPFEPENQKVLAPFLKKLKELYPNKDIWCWTGYVLENDLRKNCRKYVSGYTDLMLNCIDILVDGPFIQEKKNLMLRFRGSENQRLLHLKNGEVTKTE